MSENIVFHIDVNSAFLSWSAAYRVNILGEKEDLRNIPSIVGGDQEKRHGIVLAKSILAKQYNIQTGEAIVSAKEKCPGLVVVPPDYHLYVAASRALMRFLKKYSDHVTQYSIDEAWAEFTVNIGVSTNRLLAKMAGDFKKPDMVHTLFPSEIPVKMWRLPVGIFFLLEEPQKRNFIILVFIQ